MTVGEREATIETRGGLGEQAFPSALERALEVLEVPRDVVLRDADELRQVTRGHRASAQRPVEALPHGGVPCCGFDR